MHLSVLTTERHLDELVAILDKNPSVTTALILEIMESGPIRDLEKIQEFCEVARLLERSIAIDDYRTAHLSSTFYKKRYALKQDN